MPARTLIAMTAPDIRTTAPPIRVLLYARVSSREQRDEGYSIEAQLRLLREHAVGLGFAIAQEFIDVESASKSGRTAFNEMLAYMRKHPTCRVILVEKTDRLYRNLKDYATLDVKDWGLTIHLVKEGEVLGPDSRSSQQFVHGIKVLMARNYSLNLGEETLKGMTEKARAGIYPSCAPVGYRNVDGTNGKRTIAPDPETAPIIGHIFERFSAGSHSVKSLVKELNTAGVRLCGRSLYSSNVHQILRKRLYSGEFDWNGKTYHGTYEPLVSGERWQRVQELLDQRAANRTRKVKHNFAYTGLVHCGHCGCLLVGELKKRKYVYYHCTGNRGKCLEPYTRQEVLSREFSKILRKLIIDPLILKWLGDTILESERNEQEARTESIEKLKARHEQIEGRFERMYMDKLDGCISQELFDKQAKLMRGEQDGLVRKICEIEKSTPAPVEQAIDMLGVISRAADLFEKQSAGEQRRLLQIVVGKASWKNGQLETNLFEPFEILYHSNQESDRREKGNAGSGQKLEVWLPRKSVFLKILQTSRPETECLPFLIGRQNRRPHPT